MSIPFNAHAPAERTTWLAALETLKAAEAEVRRARGALNEALVAYIQAGARDDAPCNPPAAVG